jgi:hypothetical protein
MCRSKIKVQRLVSPVFLIVIYLIVPSFHSWFLESFAFSTMIMLICVLFILSDDISSNIESSHAATSEADSQLVKASNIQKSGSSLVKYD